MDRVNWKMIAELHRTQNVTKAAERLSLTQPALSKRLKIIEDDLGVTLMTRSTRGVRFTPEGEYVAAEAHKILAHYAEIRENLRRLKAEMSGTIRLGMTNSFVRYTLPKHLHAFKALHDAVDFDVATHVSSQIATRVETGEIDVGFICGDLEGDFDRIFIGKEHACLVNATPIALGELPQAPQISYISDPFARRLLDSWWHGHFARPPLVGLRANHGDTCLEMIASGLGYGLFLSPKFVDPSRRLFTMPLHHADGSAVCRNLWMIARAGSAATQPIAGFIDYMERHLDVSDATAE